ncbi:hypothetical protein [uncultured Psychroserpens sp.]|uniref:hypothetical protein n=1 Tax=uncultured Psychroserpens sp. TaxID=255436 RepID=UPI00261B8C05|nr:hypothetical protein [uncultured Psychroserpens sp.]
MIKKLLFLVITTCIYSSALAQMVIPDTSDCIQSFSIEAETVAGDNQRVDDIKLSWNFSEATNSNKLKLSFEVQPLNACWEGLNGTKRSEVRTFKISDFSEQLIGSKKLTYTDLNCKCIKWKAIIVDPTTNCETKTDWQFISFL